MVARELGAAAKFEASLGCYLRMATTGRYRPVVVAYYLDRQWRYNVVSRLIKSLGRLYSLWQAIVR